MTTSRTLVRIGGRARVGAAALSQDVFIPETECLLDSKLRCRMRPVVEASFLSRSVCGRCCPLCGAPGFRVVFSDVNRREGLCVSATVVECSNCRMRYLNPVPDATSLTRLYSDASIDPVTSSADETRPETRAPRARSGLRSIVHTLNGWLRGHPHDWPDEEGAFRSILDFGCHDGQKLVPRYQQGWSVAGMDRSACVVLRRSKLSSVRDRCRIHGSSSPADRATSRTRATGAGSLSRHPRNYGSSCCSCRGFCTGSDCSRPRWCWSGRSLRRSIGASSRSASDRHVPLRKRRGDRITSRSR